MDHVRPDFERHGDVGGPRSAGEAHRIVEQRFGRAHLDQRRVLLRPWFRIIGRIGEVGSDEYFFDPPKPNSRTQPKTDQLNVVFRPRRNGELFLYVNEAVIALPGLWDIFYRANQGEADVKVRRLQR